MPDMGALAAALTSLKAAKDIAEAMVSLRDAAAFQEKRLEFQSKILDAQDAAFRANDERAALVEEVRALKAKITEMEAWEAEKERYELKPFGQRGTFAYALKPQAQAGEPPHWICPTCYEQRKKSILQFHGHYTVYNAHECPQCKAMIKQWLSLMPGM